MFSASDYHALHETVFDKSYPGYRPNVLESPDGDGKWDTEKRYAHVAEKYLSEYEGNIDVLDFYLDWAHRKSIEVSIRLGIPRQFWPDRRYGALRVLEYPPGAITHEHKDFDLFTLMCYRNIPEHFEYCISAKEERDTGLEYAGELNSQIHFGEILELVVPHMKATPHKVTASESLSQYSIVYFSIPDHAAVLPSGDTVGEWIEERISRSRKEV